MKDREQIIYIVDDDISVRRALKVSLEQHGFRVEAFPCASEFLAFKHPKVASCLILDIQLPDINGLALQEAMRDRQLIIPIVFVTGHGDIPMSVKAIQSGAVDFLPKPFTEENLLNAIERAIVKNKFQNKEQSEITKIKGHLKRLSPRELEVFYFVSKGMLSKQIASKLGTALQTIKVHRSRVMQKLQAKTITELIHFAQKAGFTSSSN
jgi:FixJ family two-component response regulator